MEGIKCSELYAFRNHSESKDIQVQIRMLCFSRGRKYITDSREKNTNIPIFHDTKTVRFQIADIIVTLLAMHTTTYSTLFQSCDFHVSHAPPIRKGCPRTASIRKNSIIIVRLSDIQVN